MFRVPAALLDEPTAASYCVGDCASAWTSGEHTVIDLLAEDEEGVFEEDWSYGAGEGRLASIVPARTDLICGDRRLLYLAWLLCVQAGQVVDDDVEPPVPPHLDQLNASLRSAATFLRIDEDLIAVAASAALEDRDDVTPSMHLRSWLETVSEPDKDEMLLRVALDDGQLVRAELLSRYRGSAPVPDPGDGARRTAGELRTQAQVRRDARDRAAQQHRAQQADARARAARAAREKRLDMLAKQQEPAWRHVDQLIAARKPADYDTAVALLRDLGEISRRDGRTDAYEQRLVRLRQHHRRKSTFIDRLDRADPN